MRASIVSLAWSIHSSPSTPACIKGDLRNPSSSYRIPLTGTYATKWYGSSFSRSGNAEGSIEKGDDLEKELCTSRMRGWEDSVWPKLSSAEQGQA